MSDRSRILKMASLFVLAILFPGSRGFSAPNDLIVHEWGTTTTAHFADGKPAGRMNRISRLYILPDFVYRLQTFFQASFSEK